MTDLTPLFTQCISICEREFKPHAPRKINHPTINDTFLKECGELYTSVSRLGTFLAQVRGPYLLAANLNFSEEDKNEVDDETSALLQQFVKKLKFLERYEAKRLEAKPTGFWLALDTPSVFDTTMHTFRANILGSLSLHVSAVSGVLTAMQTKRLQRQKEMTMSDYQNLGSAPAVRAATTAYEDDEAFRLLQAEVVAPVGATLLQLEAENTEMLHQKTQDLQKIHKIESSIMDIMNLQSDLNATLSTQTQIINTLIENQEEMETNMAAGGKHLKRAGGRNSRTSRMIITMCLVMGSVLLVVDFMLS